MKGGGTLFGKTQRKYSKNIPNHEPNIEPAQFNWKVYIVACVILFMLASLVILTLKTLIRIYF